MKLTKIQKAALVCFGLVFAKSDELDAGWFAYTDRPAQESHGYPGSSCETIETVVEWYRSAIAAGGG